MGVGDVVDEYLFAKGNVHGREVELDLSGRHLVELLEVDFLGQIHLLEEVPDVMFVLVTLHELGDDDSFPHGLSFGHVLL